MADEYVEVNTFPEFINEVAVSGAKVKLMFDIDVSQYPAYREGLVDPIIVNASEIDFNGHYISNIIMSKTMSTGFIKCTTTDAAYGFTFKNGGFLNLIADDNLTTGFFWFNCPKVTLTDFKVTALFRNLSSATALFNDNNSNGAFYVTRLACDINVMDNCAGSIFMFNRVLYGDQIGIRYVGKYNTNISRGGFLTNTNYSSWYAKRTYVIGKITDAIHGTSPFQLCYYGSTSSFSNSYIAVDFVGFQNSPNLPCTNSFIVAEEIEDETVRNLFMNQSYIPVLTKAQAKSSEYLASIGWLP